MAAAAVAVGGLAVLHSRRRANQGARGWVGRRLECWVPQPPRDPLRWAAAVLWASPITAAGLIAGLGSGAAPRLSHGVVLFAGAKGATGALLRQRGYAAIGIGHVVIALDEPSPRLMDHELVHVRQAERLGVFMAPTYLTLLAVHGYARHPMEQAARRAVEGR